MVKIYPLLLVFILAACAAPPTTIPTPTTTLQPTGTLTFVEFFAVN